MVDDNRRNQVDEYRQVLKIENVKKFKEEREEEEFAKRLRQVIGAIYGTTVNQGFGVIEVF